METFIIETGPGGLPRGVLTHESGSRVEVYPQGAHVTSWRDVRGRELLFLSQRAVLAPGSAIRGGVPVVFPQFAAQGPLPKHGFARTSEWSVLEHGIDGASRAHVGLALESSERTLAIWPHRFRTELRVHLTAESLILQLRVRNPGEDPFDFTCALHAYLRVEDIEHARLQGLQGARYVDKVRGRDADVQPGTALALGGETDRIYVGAPDHLVLLDGDRPLGVRKTGFPDYVVWNPWKEKAAALPDMADSEYREMLCVEAAVAATAIRLPPGGDWLGEQILTSPPAA